MFMQKILVVGISPSCCVKMIFGVWRCLPFDLVRSKPIWIFTKKFLNATNGRPLDARQPMAGEYCSRVLWTVATIAIYGSLKLKQDGQQSRLSSHTINVCCAIFGHGFVSGFWLRRKLVMRRFYELSATATVAAKSGAPLLTLPRAAVEKSSVRLATKRCCCVGAKQNQRVKTQTATCWHLIPYCSAWNFGELTNNSETPNVTNFIKATVRLKVRRNFSSAVYFDVPGLRETNGTERTSCRVGSGW